MPFYRRAMLVLIVQSPRASSQTKCMMSNRGEAGKAQACAPTSFENPWKSSIQQLPSMQNYSPQLAKYQSYVTSDCQNYSVGTRYWHTETDTFALEGGQCR